VERQRRQESRLVGASVAMRRKFEIGTNLLCFHVVFTRSWFAPWGLVDVNGLDRGLDYMYISDVHNVEARFTSADLTSNTRQHRGVTGFLERWMLDA
jgi:hypothetical protein